MAQIIQFRRGTSAEWVTANPILAQGEMGIDLDTEQFKIGNGVDHWVDLPYGGLVGPGVPSAGTTGQALVKTSNANFVTGWATIDKAWVGLGNVANLAPADLPISDATQAALDVIDGEITTINGEIATINAEIAGLQPAGAYITSLTGDVTATGPGAAAATIANGVITNAKVATGAGIAYSKLDLTGSIVNADVATGANIDLSKLATLAALVEAYGFPASGNSLQLAISKLAYSSGLQCDTINATATIPSGYTWLRTDTTIGPSGTLIIESGATLRFI